MPQRRIIKFGKNSFIISIPKTWLKSLGLGKGDMLNVDIRQDRLIVTPKAEEISKPEKNALVLANERNPKKIRLEIVSAYLVGCSTITIAGTETQGLIMEIKEIVSRLAGLEIVEIGKNRIVAKDMLGITRVDLENTFRRIEITVRMMAESCVHNREKNVYHSLFETDKDVNKLVFLVFRVLRTALTDYSVQQALNLTVLKMYTYFDLVVKLENIGDQAKRIARWMEKQRFSKASFSRLKGIQERIVESFDDVLRAYHKKDKKLAIAIELKSPEIITMCNDFLRDHTTIVSAEVTENMKSMMSTIKHMARSVINTDSGNSSPHHS